MADETKQRRRRLLVAPGIVQAEACPDCLHTRCGEDCVCNCDAAHAEEAASRLKGVNENLVEALEAVLLFHSGSPWDEAKAARWDELAGANEATTKGLCNRVRAALDLAGVKP